MLLLTPIIALAAITQPATDDVPTPGDVRQAVVRSLPYIEKEGQRWRKERGCVSCHQVSFMVWSLNAASRHGLTVDEKQRREWNEWALSSAFSGKMYNKLADASFKELREAKMPDDEVKRLEAIANKQFLTRQQFDTEVNKLLTPESAARFAQVIRKASRPGTGAGAGGGGADLYNVMLRTETLSDISDPDAARAALLEGLRCSQLKDGFWDPSGQFVGMKRPKLEAQQISTMWALLALSYIDPLPEALVQARARAREALDKSKPGTSTESILLRLLLASRDNNVKIADQSFEQLLAIQRSDGGWSAFAENPSSDALTTGQVIYAVGSAGRNAANPAVEKALRYLLRTQQQDGAWTVPWQAFNVENNKDHKVGHQVFSYWGTAWAVIGMLQTL